MTPSILQVIQVTQESTTNRYVTLQVMEVVQSLRPNIKSHTGQPNQVMQVITVSPFNTDFTLQVTQVRTTKTDLTLQVIQNVDYSKNHAQECHDCTGIDRTRVT